MNKREHENDPDVEYIDFDALKKSEIESLKRATDTVECKRQNTDTLLQAARALEAATVHQANTKKDIVQVMLTSSLWTELLDWKVSAAKFIHLVRAPRAVAASIMPLDWGPNNAIDAARYWVQKIAYGLAFESVYPEVCLKVKYEDILQEPEKNIQTTLFPNWAG